MMNINIKTTLIVLMGYALLHLFFNILNYLYVRVLGTKILLVQAGFLFVDSSLFYEYQKYFFENNSQTKIY